MTHKRFFLRVLTLFGVVLSVLIFTTAMLTLVQAQGTAAFIAIVKEPDQTVVSGSTATFTITIINAGDVTFTNVAVVDAQVSDCNRTFGSLPAGGRTSYTCAATNVVNSFTNSAMVTGTQPGGPDITDTDTAVVTVINPDVQIAKTPDTQTVVSGSAVTFAIAVTNTGDVPLTNVTVSDAQTPDCNRASDQLPNLAPGSSTSYGCTLANVTDGFINSATATGTPPVGGDVTDADAAMVKLDDTQDCPDHMIAYWKLDETSGTAYDDFYDGHDGQCAGSCPIPVTGHVNGGQAFNGSNTGIDVPAVPGDDSFNWDVDDSFSIEFWMKADSAGSCSHGNEVIVGRDDGPDSQLHWWVGIGCWAGGRTAFVLRDTGGDLGIVVGTTDLTGGAWYHIVAVRDGSTDENRIYVNGTEEAAEPMSYSAGFGSPTAALNVGWLDLNQGYRFHGVVDEVAVYDRALSAGEVQQHRSEGLAGRWYCEEVGPFAPIIVSTPVTEATVGRPYVYDVEAAGNPAPAYTLVVSPTGMTIDPGTGLISWMPTIAQEGNHGVEVEASNSEGTDTQSFTIAVHEGTICLSDMIAYWKLGETSGTTYDDFFDGHDGTCAGQCPTPATGYVNGGQEFNGSDTGISVPADEDFDWSASDSFSIEFWLRTDSASTCSGNQVVVGRDDSSTSLHWWAGCQDGGQAAFYLIDTGGGYASVIGTTDLTNGAWHHVVATRDAGTGRIRIYVDGTEEDATTVFYTDGFDSPMAALNIGWLDLSHGFHFDGIVDEVALYDRALSADEIQQHHNDGEAGPGYCINPEIAVVKMADSEVVYAGEGVTYTYTVTNPGDVPLSAPSPSDDKCGPLAFGGGDDDSDGYLHPIEAWVYSCSMTLSADITNTVRVTGTHCLGGAVGDADTVFVDVIDPAIAVDKVADPTLIRSGDRVIYTYTVANVGDDPLSGVSVSDDKCSPVSFVGGDDNGNYELDLDETWTYTCSATISADTTNTATAIGTDSAGGPVSDTDTAFVDVIGPGIVVDKIADPTIIYSGDRVTYTYTVTNAGDDSLLDVNVSDDKCSPVSFVGGDDNGNDELDLDEIWTYVCSTAISIDTINTATATGTDSAGSSASDTDTAFVDVRDSTLTVLKEANSGNTEFEFSITYSGNSESFRLKHGEGKQFPDLAPGSYTVAETVVSEWELLSITCTNGISLVTPHTPAVTINLQSEQDVSCVFTNYHRGLAEGPYQVYLPLLLRGYQ